MAKLALADEDLLPCCWRGIFDVADVWDDIEDVDEEDDEEHDEFELDEKAFFLFCC